MAADRKVALWLTRSLNPSLWEKNASGFLKNETPLAGERSIEDMLPEMKSRIEWSQIDKHRPPFGHAEKSCVMANNSHVIELYDPSVSMLCFEIDPELSINSQLDQIENSNELYLLRDVIKKPRT